MMDSFVYIPGDEPEKPAPLQRFLPEIQEGVATTFLASHAGTGGLNRRGWILDPFGASPQLAAEVAAQGYRTLVAVNNPVMRFLLELAADPPSARRAARRPGRAGRRPQGQRTPRNPPAVPLSDQLHQVPEGSPGRSLRLGTLQRHAGCPHLPLRLR